MRVGRDVRLVHASASGIAVYAVSEGCLDYSCFLQVRLLFPGTRRSFFFFFFLQVRLEAHNRSLAFGDLSIFLWPVGNAILCGGAVIPARR
jgi:hypothetical protein